jgi:hypothetical protein
MTTRKAKRQNARILRFAQNDALEKGGWEIKEVLSLEVTAGASSHHGLW